MGARQRKIPLWRKACYAAVMVIVGGIAGLAALDLFLEHGVGPSADQQRSAALELDRATNAANARFAEQNPFGFTDRVRAPRKPQGIARRIAVLGDSFVWGDGLDWRLVWSHRLEQMVTAAGAPIEILSCAKKGWSTLDQLEFLQEYGPTLDLDAVLIGLVTNDPDVGLVVQRQLDLRQSITILPNVGGALMSRLDHVLAWHDDTYGYRNWAKALYSEENLVAYQAVLDELAQTCRESGWDLSVMITPNGPHEERSYGPELCLIEHLLTVAEIPYVNAQYALTRQLGRFSRSELQVSPVNGHPGPRIHQVYTRVALDFLITRGLIPPELASVSADPPTRSRYR